MANTRTVKEVPIFAKSRTKTNVFWSTVPENEQFRNVKVPGVVLDRSTVVKKSTQPQKHVQVVQKAKSDSAISSIASKQEKADHKFGVHQDDVSGKQNDASGFFKGASTSDGVANTSTMLESSNPRRASLKNLNVQDKKRVANLIKELAKTGEERELALERLQEERVSFEEQLSAVQEEQAALKQEREALKQRLEKSENLLKKYESQLKDVKTEKEEQDKLLKKKFQVQPQSTQTSPLVKALGTNSTANSLKDGTKARGSTKTHSTQAHTGKSESKVNTSHDGRVRWSKPQVPVYFNTLFDVKVSDVEQNSETQSMSEEYQRSRVTDSSGLHELYLREYSIQLRLQEQQIEIQRQQVQLQQQLQLLQQQQQQDQQQPGLSKQRQEQHDNPQQQQGLTQQHEDVNKQKQFYPKQQHQEQQHMHQQQPLGYMQKLSPSEQENTFKEFSPTQQTNLLQKRTPDQRDQQTETERQADTIRHEHQVRSPRQRDHQRRENSRREHKTRQIDRSQTEDRPHTSPGSLSRNHYHHLGYNVEKTSSAQEYHTERNKSKHNTDSIHNYDERHRVSKRKSPRKSYGINDATQVDLNNNEYFRPRSPGQKQLKDRNDMNGNLMQERGLQESLSDSNETYSETDSDVEHHHTSERPCHCGYYPNHIRQQYDQPISKRSHSKGNPDHKARLQHHSPYTTNTDHQSLLHDAHRSQVRESQPPVGHHNHHIHKGEYRRVQDMHEIHSSQDYHGVPYYVTHEHMKEPAFEAAFFQPSELELSTKHQPRGHEFYSTRQLGLPTSSLSSPKLRLTDDLPSHGQQYFRPQINQDKSKDLLDDYIYNHRTAGHYNTKLNIGNGPMNEGNKQLTKRKISRRGQDLKQRVGDTIQGGRLPMTYPTSEQRDENPGYSLYKPNIPHLPEEYPKNTPDHSLYPNSLIEIVEDLEVNSGYEETYSDETEEPGYYSDEEESTVLDNIFFLKR